MSVLYRVLYAAHCNGTHHKLAMRALQRLEHKDAEAWRRVFLKHADRLMEGSKAPDKLFKDFTNHVLHVGDGGEWGGAKRAAASAYGRVVMLLRQRNWPAAVYAAGVLSHYYTDPLMPFHTGSSEAENNLHRAVEWSISKAFEELWRRAPEVGVTAPREGAWVEAMVRDGADASYAHYRDLIDDYDLDAGVSDPPKGLTGEAWSYLPPLLAHGAEGFARLLDRAFEEAEVAPPKVDLTLSTVVASLQIPVKWVLKRMEDAEERATVAAMHAELTANGVVESNLPEEVKVVRKALTQRAKRRAAVMKPSAERRRPAESDAAPRRREAREEAAAEAPATVAPPAASPPRRQSDGLLALDADVVDAPSIGPKTADRLRKLGIETVGDLLDCDPQAVADGLDYFRFTKEVIEQWRDQAQLLTEIPRLRQSHAVMLVHAGYRDRAALRTADPKALGEALMRVAESDEMQRALRSPRAPDLDTIADWIEAAGALQKAA